ARQRPLPEQPAHALVRTVLTIGTQVVPRVVVVVRVRVVERDRIGRKVVREDLLGRRAQRLDRRAVERPARRRALATIAGSRVVWMRIVTGPGVAGPGVSRSFAIAGRRVAAGAHGSGLHIRG